jgi:para-aminobenzoate synthetase component 1
VEVFEFEAGGKEPFEKLECVLNKYKLSGGRGKLPAGMFIGGWAGYFGYEFGRYIEKIPETAVDDLGLALVRLCFYDRVICYDHAEGNWWAVALEIDGESEPAESKLDWLCELLGQAENINVDARVKSVKHRTQSLFLSPPSRSGLGNWTFDAGINVVSPQGWGIDEVDVSKLRCNMSRGDYFSALEKIRRYIYDGEVYQINFSQRFECDYDARAIDLYHWQNEYNPSPYAAYIGGDDFSIVSTSPEMFITLRDGVISTKPIKGTRRRISGEAQAEKVNKANFMELVESEKDQAELNMIIDLERNDLARICEPGTRRVSQPRTIETYPTVFHAAATIEGRVKNAGSRRLISDILKAVFPGGSITGAPKIRAMEIIDELEPTQRSVYTGSIGFIGVDGSVCLNIAIRTVIITGGVAYAQTGGGIVADSEPQAEWDETIIKAQALLAGIAAVNRCGKKQRTVGLR